MAKKPKQKKDSIASPQKRYDQLSDHLKYGATDARTQSIAFKNSTIDYLDRTRQKYFPDVDSTKVMNDSQFKKYMKNQKKQDSLHVAMSKEKTAIGKLKQFAKTIPTMTGDAATDKVWQSVYKNKK
jgi:flagellar biosynthesis chaperone FliJ